VRWSKLKQLVENGFTPSLAKRLTINSAAYGACTCGHAWLTLDGDVIANFCTRAQGNRDYSGAPKTVNKMYDTQCVEYGELSRQDAYRACWAFVHEMSIEQSLMDSDPLIQTLAVVDRRVGKRRLKEIDGERLHRMARKLLDERRKLELASSA
jgi:hypothetical protein